MMTTYSAAKKNRRRKVMRAFFWGRQSKAGDEDGKVCRSVAKSGLVFATAVETATVAKRWTTRRKKLDVTNGSGEWTCLHIALC